MLNHYDIAYYLGLGLSAPYWLIKPSARRKVLGALANRNGQVPRRVEVSSAFSCPVRVQPSPARP